MNATHTPVLTDRVLTLLAPALRASGAIVVDATVGLGGHAAAVLTAFPHVRLVGLDRDPDALERSGERLHGLAPGRVELVHAVYDEVAEILDRLGHPVVQGILFDLGVSSLQLDTDDRGFAYSRDAPLDMRMDQTRGRTAADVLNTYDADALTRILREYGEERFARRIAGAIVQARAVTPFATSARLADLVRDAIPAPARRTGGNPAKRTFQALRIEVNAELDVLARALPAAFDALAVSGRLVVLSYHSLEDRLVKRQLRGYAEASVPPDLPVVPEGAGPRLRWLTRGAEPASETEKAENPRAASVRLRAVERTAPNPDHTRKPTGGAS
ncbi:16S rRNA (cytosine(1402)-N(4))-methyltransferase [Frankia sp. CcI156]|uniref:16S rRNA (cytosine(1402)-N(4))-methyltransferase RsmH n=1 Tax=Frankia TaxID=1854 RepID=UPI0005534CA9|nr:MULTISPECIES: 16S rRNA (cytosine(1402)-N(4))-methyltransferase RsmH [Frankia]OHV57647.1 16S rRNA (cytosine(1402)-N(4))-methyltransferase [Frankia sp. CgIS1]ONH29295.1 16S rRNA (cytosine(1402)-N(4))-methyltransferase [Frankia sp. CcI156]